MYAIISSASRFYKLKKKIPQNLRNTHLYKKFKYLQIDLCQARKKFLTVFSNFQVDFPSKSWKIPYIWMIFISKLTRAKRERIFLQNLEKFPMFEWHLSPNWPAWSAKENFWLYLNLLSRFASNCRKPPYLSKEFISKLICAKRERKFFSIFWVNLL